MKTFISDVDHRRRELVYVRLLVFNKMERDARSDPNEANQTVGTKEVTLVVLWEIGGFHVIDMMPPEGHFDAEYILTHIMDSLLAKVFLEERKTMNFD
jgi:hypothetical protein